MIGDVTQAAERAVASGATVAELDDLARQAGELDLTQPGPAEASTAEERARLAVLLDFLGLRAPAARLLVPVERDGAAQVAGLRNIEGMLAARHGEYERAIGLFTQALGQAPNGSALRTKILANRRLRGGTRGPGRHPLDAHRQASRRLHRQLTGGGLRRG